mmetsp:Transcript_2235/g.4164  ORF Transcript_2235/g.4164 Transcript_2235/m.4164 type:complete len:91 (-) Transcript_2235:38-310(-)
MGDKVVILTNPEDVLKYFNVEDLPDNFIESGISRSPLPADSAAVNDDDKTSHTSTDTSTATPEVSPIPETLTESDMTTAETMQRSSEDND